MPDEIVRVSVIVINWNRRELLRSCLESLASQIPSNGELIVVDNGSSDGSVEEIRSFAQHVPFAVSIVENSENRGFCAANNQGIARSRGRYIALLNNDAEAEPGWLDAMCDALDARPDFGMVASKILVHENPSKIDKTGHLIYPDGQNRGRGSGELDRGQYERVEEVLWPDGCAALYRKEMLDEIGGFDEDFFAYADDAELGLRARIAGWRCVYVPQAVVRHHRGSTLGLLSSGRLELIERNRILLVAKHFPASLIWLNGAYFAARLAAGTWASLRGKGEAARFVGAGGKFIIASALLKGSIAGLRLAPAMWRKRRQMAGIRKLTPKQTRQLLFRHKISLKELSEQAI